MFILCEQEEQLKYAYDELYANYSWIQLIYLEFVYTNGLLKCGNKKKVLYF